MRLIITIILAILWLLFGIYFVKPCFVDDCGCDTTKSEATVKPQKDASAPTSTSASKVTGPLLFSWNKAETITGDGWDARRKAILDGLGDNQILEITGQYRADEVNSTTYENLGLARANEVAKLLKPPLTDDRIRLVGQLVKELDADKTSNFKSFAIKNLINTETIKEIDDKTQIYFPPNSTKRINNAEIESYLDDVVERVKKSGEKVSLTGHTDNLGTKSSNITLGLKRANMVKNYLASKGVSPAQLIVKSEGEAKPIASNKTKAGRADNRRVELQIIK